MREILFRGFHPDENGKEQIFLNDKWIKGHWVYGYYYHTRKTTYCTKKDYDAHPDNDEYYILYDKMSDWGLPNHKMMANVIPETVGQYTGLTDKNGTKIFEGDILKVTTKADTEWEESYKTKVRYIGGAFAVEMQGCDYDETAIGWAIDEWSETDTECEVIGNIHDNPELLEV